MMRTTIKSHFYLLSGNLSSTTSGVNIQVIYWLFHLTSFEPSLDSVT